MAAIIYGHFTDELDLLEGIRELQEKGIQIDDVRTPFPVHGLDQVLKYHRSHLPKVAFLAGVVGGTLGLLFQIWVFTQGWPLNFGGKPFLSLPSFIPVTFELTVLFAAYTMGIAFLVRSKLGPGSEPDILDELVTDDHFQIILSDKNNQMNETELSAALAGTGALDVKLVKGKQ
ncbi:DUF3341 domain-containing protein [Roseimarinus sediminis]|uniref:DUF3341 domain-containing protein n=1 Tax=Roseimarinus sediminis TaxID=1610899 RepID=UPI003D1F96DF